MFQWGNFKFSIMSFSKRKISSSLFIIILICFLLPFVTVSCSNTPVVQLSGLELLVGSTYETAGAFGSAEVQNIPPDFRIILAFFSAVIGLIASLRMRKNKKVSFVASGFGLVGALLLLWFKSELDRELIRQSGGLAYIQVEYNLGFWGSFWLFASAAFYQLFPFFRSSRTAESADKPADYFTE